MSSRVARKVARAWLSRSLLTGFLGALLVSLSTLPTSGIVGHRLTGSQTSARHPNNKAASIRGRVVDDRGQPFPNAVVSVRAEGAEYEDVREVATDENGAFEVDSLPRRAYVARCSANGFVEDQSDGSSAYHLTGDFVELRLTKGGVLTGRVTGQSGEPLVKATVMALRTRDSNGQPIRFVQDEDRGETDDRGTYRIYGLDSGSYVLRIDQASEYDDSDHRNEVPIYYPSGTGFEARELKLDRGQEIGGLDIHHASARGHRISGICTGATNPKSSGQAYLELIQASNGLVLDAGYKSNEQNGAFTFGGVPDGDYFLIAKDDHEEPGAASSLRPVTVKGKDVAGIELKLERFGSLAGHVALDVTPKLERPSACQPSREAVVAETVIKAIRIDETRHGGSLGSPFSRVYSCAVDEEGDFRLNNVPPGQYILEPELANHDLYVRAVTTRPPRPNEPVSPWSLITINSGGSVAGVAVAISDGAALLEGTVVQSTEIRVVPPDLMVHLIPSLPDDTKNPARFREAAVGSNGKFAFRNVPPGKYLILAKPRTPAERESMLPAAWSPDSRTSLLRDARAEGKTIDLQRCQSRVAYILNLNPPPPARQAPQANNP